MDMPKLDKLINSIEKDLKKMDSDLRTTSCHRQQ